VTTAGDARVAGVPPAQHDIVLVAAVADNGVIGSDGRLPWRMKSDLRHFRTVTWGKPVVMGRKTFLSIGKPLPGRTNIVVTRDAAFAARGVLVVPSVPTALAVGHADVLRRGGGEIAVIGGADIYAQTLAVANRLVITRVHLRPDGDTTFPPIDPALWTEVERNEHAAGSGDDAGFAVLIYRRRDEVPWNGTR
jgi:dihydrofolate reductase